MNDTTGCALEEGIAAHSSTLVWRIPWTEEPGGPQSMGAHGVGPYSGSLLCTYIGRGCATRKKASPVAHMVKNPPERQETQVRSLHWEDPLEEGMATHSSVLA